MNRPHSSAPHKRRGALRLPSIFAGLLTACLWSGFAFAEPPTDGPAKTASSKTASAGIKLVNPGKGKTSVLRYAFKSGATSRWSLSVDNAMTIAGTPKMTMPQVAFESTITVKRVDKSGTAYCEFTLNNTRVKPAGKLKASALKAINAKLAKIKGVEGTVTFDSRGRLLAYKRKPLPKKAAALEVLLMNFDQVFGQASVPLPEEPVAQGATWVVDRVVVNNAISLRQKATYRLLKRGGPAGVHKLSVAVTQSAKPQSVKLPGMPADLRTKLLKADGRGTSTLTILGDRIGTDGTVSVKLSLAIEMHKGDQSGKAGVKLDSRLSFKRVAAK